MKAITQDTLESKIGRISKIIPMGEKLLQDGKTSCFTSTVFYVESEGQHKTVLKLYNNAEFKELTEIIGEVFCYKASEFLCLGLVPKTQIIIYDQSIGTLQDYISHSLDKSKYSVFLSSNSENIQILKLYWFILGQWDTSEDNVLFILEDKPIAIDNANIAHIQAIDHYGRHPFIRSFYCEQQDQGSTNNPLIIKGTSVNILTKLEELFEYFPQWYKEKFSENPTQQLEFVYFIKDHHVWLCHDKLDQTPLYFVKDFIESLLGKFYKLKEGAKDIFAKIIKEEIGLLSQGGVSIDQDVNINDLPKQLDSHFDKIAQQISDRINLAQYYYNSTHILHNMDNVLPSELLLGEVGE